MMKILLALLLCSGLAWGEDKDVSEGNVKCKILGHSGKMMFSLKDQEFNTSDEVVVEMEQVVEIASGGSAAGKGNKHRVTSFANQDFKFTGSEDGKYKDLDVKKIKFNSSISNMEGSSLTILLFIFKQSGDILNGDEVTQVEKGTIKFNIELKNWRFCEGSSSSDCSSKGVAVDFTISVKSKGKPEKKSRPKSSKYPDKKQPENYDLENANMQLSRMVLIGGNVTEMEAGYPKYEVKNKKQSFTFRFPRFNGTLTYDPMIDLKSTSGGNGRQTANVLNVLLIALSLALAGLLA